MKKALFSMMTLLLGVTAMAADLEQLTLSISTPGPDFYADGTPVLTGETYLLVYVRNGGAEAFQGVLTDGTLADPTNNVIVTKGVAVEGSKCGFKAIQYPADLYPSGGSWVIVLLDTRDAAGAVGGLVAAQGAGPSAAAAAGDSTALNAVGVTAAQGAGNLTLTASATSAAPAGTPAPVIAEVNPQGETVNVRIRNFSEKALYEVQSTTDLASGAWQSATGGKQRVQATEQAVVQGANGPELPVAVQVPSNDRVRFFRVIVPGSK